jgi:BirA family biotin operon repressor/biotin-[acetyl-CoA-carboxylase] ligase
MMDVQPENPAGSGAGMELGKHLPAGVLTRSGGWTLHEYSEVDSTNLVAACLPAWHAVRADTQTGGRGRFQRKWVSDPGGMWLSAVVPIGENAAPWNALPLMAGLAVATALEKLGVPEIRMRWPNDLLVGERKLAGLLIDKFAPGLAVVGIGLNISNDPELHSPELRNMTARLSQFISPAPTPRAVALKILHQLKTVIGEMKNENTGVLMTALGRLWRGARRVELDLDGVFCTGRFEGVHPDGRIILAGDNGLVREFEPWQVRHLREI